MFDEDEKVFGEDTLSQSVIEFQIYSFNSACSVSDLKLNFLSFIAEKTKNYIWNYSPIQIFDRPDHLMGSLEFGDLYDEEWILIRFLQGKLQYNRCKTKQT